MCRARYAVKREAENVTAILMLLDRISSMAFFGWQLKDTVQNGQRAASPRRCPRRCRRPRLHARPIKTRFVPLGLLKKSDSVNKNAKRHTGTMLRECIQKYRYKCGDREKAQRRREGRVTSKPMMQWAPSPRSFEGKLHADRCTVEYFGHGNHSADAVRFRTARSVVAAAAPAGDLASPSEQIFYLELLVLSTSKEDEDDEDDGAAGAEYLGRSRVRNSEGSSSGSRAHSEQVHPYHSSSSSPAAAGPWRVRARRLVSTHLQSTEPALFQAFPAVQQEEETGEANGSVSRNRRSPPPPPRLPVPLSSSSSDRLLRAQQIAQVSLPFAFTLHSRTLLQMPTRSSDRHRLRRAREKMRLNHRICIGFALAKDDDTRKHKSGAARARVAESLGAVQSMGDHNSHQEDLGTTLHSLAYVGKTGRVLSNGQIYLQCEPYGAGDVVGVGIVRDSHTFFFTRNGKLVGTLPASDLPHFEAFTTEEPENDNGDKDESMNDSNMSEDNWPPAEPLYPAVSLHEAGECVRLIPDARDWRFDLAAFQTQIQSQRQQALQEYVAERNEPQQDEEERVIHALLRDYFHTYGYGSAYEAFQQATGLAEDSDLVKKQNLSEKLSTSSSSANNNDGSSSAEETSSLRFRHEIRQLIYTFQTAQALDRVKRNVKQSSAGKSWLWFACDLLSVADVLTYAESKPTSIDRKNGFAATELCASAWNVGGAIALAQTLLHPYTAAAQHTSSIRQDLAQFMSLLLYSSLETVPETSSALRFLSFSFREHVADQLNALLLHDEDQDASLPSSAMDIFLTDLQSLQRKCLQHRTHVFPGAHATASKSTSRKRRSRRKSSMSSSSSGSSYDPEEREAGGLSSQSDDDDLEGSDGHDTE